MFQFWSAKRSLAVDRRVAGADQQCISFGERHVEHPREQLHHLATGLCAAGFEEAEMPR
jgi:hypothetical protein